MQLGQVGPGAGPRRPPALLAEINRQLAGLELEVPPEVLTGGADVVAAWLRETVSTLIAGIEEEWDAQQNGGDAHGCAHED